MRYKFMWLPVLLLGSGCSESVEKCPALMVDVGEIRESLPVSELFDSLRYVPLETTEECIFSCIDKLEIDSRKNMYVFDRDGMNAVYKFDSTGKYLGRIGTQGRGPGEYRKARDFVLYRDSIIEIYDALDKRMSYTTSGKFLKEELPVKVYNVGQFVHWGDTLAYYGSGYGEYSDLVVEIDSVSADFFQQGFPESYERDGCFSIYENRMYFTDLYNDTVYRFEDHRMKPFLYVDFGRKKLPFGIRELEKVMKGEYCYAIGEVKFSERYFSFSFMYGTGMVFVFQNRSTRRLYLTTSLNNDIDGIPFLFSCTTPNSADCMIGSQVSSWICERYEELKKAGSPVSSAMQALIGRIDENSNPVVVFAYPKNECDD